MFPADPSSPPAQPDASPTASPADGQDAGTPASGASDASDGAAGTADGWQPAAGGPPAAPVVTLPKGGGAVRDIGEKFSVSAATGTARLTVPVATSPGRAGFGPSLSLGYDSGGGNGPFGLGWKMTLPAVTRKTDKGLPRYVDDPDADTFLLSGAEDLVPVRAERDGVWREAPAQLTESGRDYLVQRYRPRIEGLFARIERWRDLDTGETHWRTISSGNVTTVYGATAASRIADPADPARVFSWLICLTFDDTGNAARYDYVPEDSAAVDAALPSERNRTPLSRSANRYLKRIRYGNTEPWWPDIGAIRSGAPPRWLFETVFDYGDHAAESPLPTPDRTWPCRPDPFSTYRPGFEVRTYRRCHRVLMFHHFPDEPGVGADCLVASTNLTYASTGGSGMTTIAAVTHAGYRRRDGGYHAGSLPPLELRYSEPVVSSQVRDLSEEALANLPAGVDGTTYQWVDLDGEGLSGVLARQGGGWFYKHNLGDGRFGPAWMLAAQPAATGSGATGFAGSRQELLDLAGDGHLDLAELGGPMPGCYQRDGYPGTGAQPADGDWERAGFRSGGDGWQPFRPFRSRPNISWDDPDLRMVDLDGDGLADVLITGDDAFTWYPSLGLDGFGVGQRAFSAHPWSEERGPRLMLADPEQTIYLADMTGDGLSDLMRVRDGEVCYWPNTGYGQFGTKVTMDGSPWMDRPDQFDQRRVRVADVDGTGLASLIYLGQDCARVYLNQSGNGYGGPFTLPHAFPQVDSLAHVMVTDLLGHGTACLVWSSPLPGDAGRQVRYVDLMAAGKPYLLTEMVNNLGAETRISYAPSTTFYLEDQAVGRPWITRLPFPVHVVQRVETIDRINRNKFTTRHAYHHGYFDGFEREFRGFGMVEQWDTEDLAVLEDTSGQFTNLDAAADLPPVLTRTWLHTGVFSDEEAVSRLYAREYWRQPGGDGPDLPDTVLPTTLRLAGQPSRPWQLSRTDAREACRALKGMPLREEVYALDGSPAESRPYLVTEHNYTIDLLQPAVTPVPDGPQNYHAVLLTHGCETVTAHYERVLYQLPDGSSRADPRITHDVVLAIDDYGNPLRTASAGYGRRYPDRLLDGTDQAAQARLRLTCTDNAYTNPVETPDGYRTPMPARTRTFEVVGLSPARRLFGFAELRDGLDAITAELPFQDWDADPAELPASARRLIAHTAVLYRRDDLSGALPPGVLEPLALPYQSYRQAFTGSLVVDLYRGDVDDVLLRASGYLREGKAWLVPSGRVSYSPGADDDPAAELKYARRHFFRPRRFTDPFGNTAHVTYDRYDLLVSQTRDALGNLVVAGERDASGEVTRDGNDYRVLAPRLVSDPNRNRSAVAFDALGRVCGTAVMGKPEERLGDSLGGFDPDPPAATVAAYFADPFAHGHALLGEATTRLLYDLDAYRRSEGSRPAGVAILARETHVSDLGPDQLTRIQRRFSYSDGFGREIQRKGQAAAGPVVKDGPAIPHRWTGSGWTVFNNKGKPVRQYEPFFTATPEFEFASAVGVSPVLFYDPVGRVVVTLNPDGGYAKTTFDPWYQDVWDAADTVLLDPRSDPDAVGYAGRYLAALSARPGGWTTWYDQRISGALGDAARRAAEQTACFAAGTPARRRLDSVGRTFLTVEHNRVRDGSGGRLADQYCRTHSLLDIQGNEHEVRDAVGRTVMRYGFSMAGGKLTHAGMDTGGGQSLPDVLGKPVYSRNSRGYTQQTGYDALRRPVRSYVSGPGIEGDALVTRTEYGESVADAEARNLRTRVARLSDGTGLAVSSAYDFKGNLLGSTRQLAAPYTAVALDWSGDVSLEPREYASATSYDALNRPVSMTTPDDSVLLPCYDPASMLERIDGHLRGAAETTAFAEYIEYNARGQRTLIEFGNGTSTRYRYDRLTFRLVRLITLRGTQRIQDLKYTYDAVGNPTQLSDRAQQDVFFRNQVVSPTARYVYDALYRLIEATGREHLGQAAAGGQPHPVPPSSSDVPRAGLPQPGDGTAMARYTERYTYDEVGNLLLVRHRSSDPVYSGWTRLYRYDEPSLLEPGRPSNRLSGTGPLRSVSPPPRFGYDEQGNTTSMPELPLMAWDYADRLRATARQPEPDPRETTYYVYDATGQRARKVTQQPAGGKKHERIYLGAFEVFREYAPDGALKLERETLHVFDDKHRLALIETRTAGTDPGPAELIRYQLANHLDSSVLELDQVARVISYEEYYPYGSTSYQAVRAGIDAPKRYRYTGKERDAETGLYYYGARYFSWLARWINCDPAGLADGANLYAYARDNPSSRVDPTGRYSFSDFASDVWGGLKSAARGVAEPVLIVADFGQMGAAIVTKEFFPDSYHDVEWLSATGKAIEGGTPGWRAGLVVATAIPTGGASTLVNNVATVFEKDMSPDEARSFLVQGAVAQVASVAVGTGISKATGSGLTGRGAPNAAADQAMLTRLTEARNAAGKTSEGNATFAVGRDAAGKITPVRESIPDASHAEPQVKADLPGYGGRTIAVDQVPCANCWSELSGASKPQQPGFFQSDIGGSTRVITPRDPANLAGSPKTAALKAAAGKVSPVPFGEFTTPFAPPVVQSAGPQLQPQTSSQSSARADFFGLTPAEIQAQQCFQSGKRTFQGLVP